MSMVLAPMVLAQMQRFDELRRALTREFSDHNSTNEILIVLAALAALVILTWLLQRWQQRPRTVSEPFDAKGLFTELLGKLDMPDDQRHLLETMANDLRLPNPAVILISRRLFDENLIAWQSRRHSDRPAGDVLPGRIRQRLFP